jgi:5-formyltetrahydrofolate cyclo-ligase
MARYARIRSSRLDGGTQGEAVEESPTGVGTKADLRRAMLGVRARLALEGMTRAERLCRRLIVLLASLGPRRLVAYAPLGGEIDPGAVVGAYAAAGVPVFLPRWRDGGAEFAHLETGERLGDDDQRVVILVPGVAFDSSGGRLGRGGGWYDRVLRRYPRAVRVGCGYDEEVLDRLPLDPWDAAMHHVVTDARSIAVDQLASAAGECAHERT